MAQGRGTIDVACQIVFSHVVAFGDGRIGTDKRNEIVLDGAIGYFGEDDTGTLIVTQSHNIVVGAFNRFGIIQGIGVEADRSAQNLRTDILFGVVDDVESPVTYRVEPSSIERIIGCSSRIVVGKYVDSEEPIDAVVVKHSLPIGIITGQKTFYLYGKIDPLVSNR